MGFLELKEEMLKIDFIIICCCNGVVGRVVLRELEI